MNPVVIKLFICAMMLFLSGFFLSFATRNIFKIFFAILIMLNGASMMLNVWQDGSNALTGALILAASSVVGFGGIFIIYNIVKKFRTLDIDKIHYEAQSQSNGDSK